MIFIESRSVVEQIFEQALGVDDEIRSEIQSDQGPDIAGLPESGKLASDEIREVLSARAQKFRPEFVRDNGQEGSDITRLSIGLGAHPKAVARHLKDSAIYDVNEYMQECSALLSWIVGVAIGRWDIRIAQDSSLAPKLPDPFDPLPVCPPGMLIGPNGLPADPGRIVSEEWLRTRPETNMLPPEGSVPKPTIPDSEYPLRISWEGILVDDPGKGSAQPHREDIVRRVHDVLDLLWKNKAHEIEQEACEILGVGHLRDYFRRSAGFFQDHLKRYSKSRRKAPIYWPLSTASGSYTLWIYYHRLTDQTLYTCVNDYVKPKLETISRDIKRFQSELVEGGTAQKRQKLEELMDFEQELKDLRDDLLRVARLPYKPNLNDGVMITAAPLWRRFRHNQWRKDLEACWKKLKVGEYDWAHLAYAIWPDRVKDKCKADLSIAIAHGLEDVYQGELARPKKGRKKATA